MKIELIAALFTVLCGLITILFTEGAYDAWDGLVALFVLYVAIKHKSELCDRETIVIIRIGLSIAFTVLLMVVLSIYDKNLAREMDDKKWSIFDIEFLVATALLIPVWYFYRDNSQNS